MPQFIVHLEAEDERMTTNEVMVILIDSLPRSLGKRSLKPLLVTHARTRQANPPLPKCERCKQTMIYIRGGWACRNGKCEERGFV